MYYGTPADVVGMQYPPLGHLQGPPPDHSQTLHQNRHPYPNTNTHPPVHHYPVGQPPHTRQPYPPMHAPTSVPLPALNPNHSLHEPPGLASNIHIAPAERISSQGSSPRQDGVITSPGAPGSVDDATTIASTPPSDMPCSMPGGKDQNIPISSSSSSTTPATSHKTLESQSEEPQQRGDDQSPVSPSQGAGKESDAWEREPDRSENGMGMKEDQHDHEEQPSNPIAGKMPHSTMPAMGVGGVSSVPPVPTYGYPIPFYGSAMPPMYSVAGPRGQMGYPVPTGQAPPMMPGRPLNAPPPPPPHLPPHNYKHAYMGGGGGAHHAEYGGHYMPPEQWHTFPSQQSLQKKPKELDKAMWVGNVSSDTTVADLQAIFEAPPTEEEGDIQVDIPESIFILSKSNCAFVNYATHEAVHRAVKRFHDREFKNTRLVCRPRKDPGSSDSYGSRHATATRHPPPSQHPTSRSASSVGDGTPATPAGDDHEVQPHLMLPASQLKSTPHDIDDKEPPDQGTPSTDATSMNMDSLRRELSPSPSVSSGGGSGGPVGGGGGTATPRERESRPRQSRPGKALKHLNNLKSRSRSSSSSTHHVENRYYILKGLNEEDLKLSVQYGVWATQDHLVPILNQAFADKHDHIVKTRAEANWMPSVAIPISPELKAEVARYIEEAEAEGRSITYEEAEAVAVGSTPTKTWGILFPIQWLFVHKVPFTATSHLRNPYYDNREVKLSKDGTEVEPTVGEQLLAEFRKHRELKKAGSSVSGTSTPVGSESGTGDSRRSSVAGAEDKRESASASPKPYGIRGSTSSQSNKSESTLSIGGVQASETHQSGTLAAKSSTTPTAQLGQQQQGTLPGSATSPAPPSQPTTSTQSSSRKQGSSHARSHHTNPMHSGQRTGPGSGGYRPQGQLQYGPGPYGGPHQGYGPYGGPWPGKPGPRGSHEYHSSNTTGHLMPHNATMQDQHPPSNMHAPPSQQQYQYYNPRRNQSSTRYYQQHPGSSGLYGPSDGNYPAHYIPHPPPGGSSYDYAAPSGGQYYNQPYSRRRNQGAAGSYRHTTDAHASGPHSSGYKHAGGPPAPSITGSQDTTGQAYPPGPGSPPQGGYRIMQPMMNAYPGMPPMMGYQFHHGQPLIPVPVPWQPTQAAPAPVSAGEAAIEAATSSSDTKAGVDNTINNRNQSPASINPVSSSTHPTAGMAMMMGIQGYPAAAYAPFPAMPPMAQGMPPSGDVMMEGMMPSGIGYDGIQYMYIPAEMADAYHQPMYYYGHMPMPPGAEGSAVAPSAAAAEGMTMSEPAEGHIATRKKEDESNMEQKEHGSTTGTEMVSQTSGDGDNSDSEDCVSSRASEQEDSLTCATMAKLTEANVESAESLVDTKEISSSSNGSNGSNGSITNTSLNPVDSAPTPALAPASNTAVKKSRKAKKPTKGAPIAISTETRHE
ncbi:hypothetical protein BGW41_003128 [Actinomortierella wolfii]|nr:hypothetical protein BGW41_003128 [Actinomortierella wolfii]